MHYDDQNYRLAPEAKNPALQVTHGCSYNKCSFCSLYGKMSYSMCDKDEILEDIKELSKKDDINRIYLTNGDPLNLTYDELMWVFNTVREYIPTVETFTMFATIHNIRKKTLEELKSLKSHGLTDIYIGLENISDEGFKLANKGYDLKTCLEQIEKVEQANIDINIMLIPGLLGEGMGEFSGLTNAKYLNMIKPKIITFTGLMVIPGTELWYLEKTKKYKRAMTYDRVVEMNTFFNNINLDDAYFYSFYTTGTDEILYYLKSYNKPKELFFPLFNFHKLSGYLPEDLEKSKDICKKVLDNFSQKDLRQLDLAKKKMHSPKNPPYNKN